MEPATTTLSSTDNSSMTMLIRRTRRPSSGPRLLQVSEQVRNRSGGNCDLCDDGDPSASGVALMIVMALLILLFVCYSRFFQDSSSSRRRGEDNLPRSMAEIDSDEDVTDNISTTSATDEIENPNRHSEKNLTGERQKNQQRKQSFRYKKRMEIIHAQKQSSSR